MPFDVNVRSLEAALEVVGGAGAANGVIALDTPPDPASAVDITQPAKNAAPGAA